MYVLCILIYDCYYLNSVDIRELPLNIPKKDSRMPKLQKAIKDAEWEYIENDSDQLKIRVKKFYYGDIEDNAINQGSVMGIRGVPSTIIFRKGKEIDRLVGFPGEAKVKEWLDKSL